MSMNRLPLQPLKTDYQLELLEPVQLELMKQSTLDVISQVGVRFPSHKALAIFADHNVPVDWKQQIVKIPPDVVLSALTNAPRYFTLGARDPDLDLHLQQGTSYFTTDGCGVETIDITTGEQRPSRKADVAMMARVADYLPSIGFLLADGERARFWGCCSAA